MHAAVKAISRALLIAMIVVGCVGCAIKPVRETAVVDDPRAVLIVARDIERLANQCWRRTPTFLHDGIQVDARLTLSGSAVVSAARYARDIGLQKPFFIATVYQEDSGKDLGTRVRIQEGDYACHLTGSCFSLNYTSEVQQWLQGQQTCVNRK